MLYSFENFTLDEDRRELRRSVDVVPVEPQVFDLLLYLIRNRDRVVSKDDLISSIWGGRIVSESALNTRINAARSAVGDTGDEQRLIKTHLRKGVRFVADVRESSASPPAAEIAVAGSGPTLSLPDRSSIAVLPFTNMSGDPEQDYFADGMAEEIITALSRCKWLFVIARNSSFTYKGRTVDVRQVGRELGVRYVLEGSVRRAGNRLRFTGQLIDATTGAHIWADRFDGELSDVFALQDLFTQSVVSAIEPSLQLAEIERLRHKPIANLDAYDELLRAQQREYEFTADSLAAALRHLERALSIDPTYAPAMAFMGYCYAERHHQGWSTDPSDEARRGVELAMRAAETAKDDANVLWMAAFATFRLDMNAQAAKELADRSLRLNPNSAIALAISGWIEANLGNPKKAIEALVQAERLSPRDPRGWFFSAGLSISYFIAADYENSAAAAKRALVQNPRFTTSLRTLAASLAQLGRIEEARASAKQVLAIEPGFTISGHRARLGFFREELWDRFSTGMRLAGLPD